MLKKSKNIFGELKLPKTTSINLLKSKSGKFSANTVNIAVIGLVFIVILLAVYSVLIPEAQTAGDSLNVSNQCVDAGCFYNATGNTTLNIACFPSVDELDSQCAIGRTHQAIPLNSLFSGTGVVFVIIMAVLMIVIVRAYIKGKK